MSVPCRPVGSFMEIQVRKAVEKLCGELGVTPRQLIEVAQGMDNLDKVPDFLKITLRELEGMGG